jgi:hypothetical protein
MSAFFSSARSSAASSGKMLMLMEHEDQRMPSDLRAVTAMPDFGRHLRRPRRGKHEHHHELVIAQPRSAVIPGMQPIRRAAVLTPGRRPR